ncbi:scavenger receptor cysteine-rich domain superfamily protein-like [Diadema antillarum]|uniref:scavenger receptor cysteine-rich domain superfamily protein-like n=1 Tax=Diadema antillarum TaxID=105358 RepID=UPI003A88C585
MERSYVFCLFTILCWMFKGSVATNNAVQWPVRLVGGIMNSTGRVEVLVADSWGTICDRQWDIRDAHVVCRQLGYIAADQALVNGMHGEEQGPVLLDNVQCSGLENELSECPHTNTTQCPRSRIASVMCMYKASLRLVNGTSDGQGRLEIMDSSGEWGTVCGVSLHRQDARVACRQLGYPDVQAVYTSDYHSPLLPNFAPGTGIITLNGIIRCSGNERFLMQCPLDDTYSCSHQDDAGIICKEKFIRLVGGIYAGEGRVEVYRGGQWGRVCPNEWDLQDATVACRQLGYPQGALSAEKVPKGDGPVLLDGLLCDGSESSLFDCPLTAANDLSCTTNPELSARVVCDVPAALINLLSGSSSLEGVVSYRDGHTVGVICDADWGDQEAAVVCRQLGYPLGNSSKPVNLDQVSGTVWYRDYQCSGAEAQLEECNFVESSATQCDPHHIAQVICGPPQDYDLRMAGSESSEQGRLDVFLDGEWGAVGNSLFTFQSGDVACRQMGYAKSTPILSNQMENFVSRGNGEIILNRVLCIGSEFRITECESTHVFDDTSSARQADPVGLICSPYELVANHPVRLVTETGEVNSRYGMVQILHDGIWGAICNIHFDQARGICTELGHTDMDLARSLYSQDFTVTWPTPPLWSDFPCFPGDNTDRSQFRFYKCHRGPWIRRENCSSERALISCVGKNVGLSMVTGTPSHTTPGDPQDGPSGMKTWHIVLIVLAVLGLVILLVGCLLQKKLCGDGNANKAHGDSTVYKPVTQSTTNV